MTASNLNQLKLVEGDLLTLSCYQNIRIDCIVQQTNAVTCHAHGLSKSIADKFPYADAYSSRRCEIGKNGSKLNRATLSDRSKLGDLVIKYPPPSSCESKNTSSWQPAVACITGQLAPGKVGGWNSKYEIDLKQDTAEKRLHGFIQGLEKLAVEIEQKKWQCIAFGDGIGCGLARGCPKQYYKALQVFASKVSIPVLVVYNPKFKRLFV